MVAEVCKGIVSLNLSGLEAFLPPTVLSVLPYQERIVTHISLELQQLALAETVGFIKLKTRDTAFGEIKLRAFRRRARSFKIHPDLPAQFTVLHVGVGQNYVVHRRKIVLHDALFNLHNIKILLGDAGCQINVKGATDPADSAPAGGDAGRGGTGR